VGLADQAVGPLKAERLHPVRRAWQRARGERDRGAAADEPGSGQARGEGGDDLFLLGETQTHEHDVGLGLRQFGGDRLDFAGSAVEAERRRAGAHDQQTRKAPLQLGGRPCGHAGFPAEQVDGLAAGRGGRAQREDQGGAGHPLGQRVAAQSGGPDQGHPVRHDQGGTADQCPCGRIVPELAADVDVGRDDPAAPAVVGVPDDPRHHLLLGQSVEVQSGQSDGPPQRSGSHQSPQSARDVACPAAARRHQPVTAGLK